MFSIYAVGVVKGYKRETRTAIHAVVDFRDAPAIAGPSMTSVLDSFTGNGAPSASASASASATNTAYPMTGSGPMTTGPITAATAIGAGGQIIYFHIE
jgi:hypothetical protein